MRAASDTSGERLRRRIVFSQPDATPPVYAWQSAPSHLRTREQLRTAGLRPGRQGVQALLVWYGRGGRPTLADGTRYAHLYDVSLARPRLRVTPSSCRSGREGDSCPPYLPRVPAGPRLPAIHPPRSLQCL